jgi:hypothetical protein
VDPIRDSTNNPPFMAGKMVTEDGLIEIGFI